MSPAKPLSERYLERQKPHENGAKGSEDLADGIDIERPGTTAGFECQLMNSVL